METPHTTKTEPGLLGISTMGIATLTAVIAVVVVITLSSIRGLAMRENESHVRTLLEALGSSLTSEVHASPPRDLRDLTQRDASLKQELADTRWTGELLFRHGYFVELVRDGQAGAVGTLVAWPSQYGRTGNRAFLWSAEEGLVIRANSEDSWSGMERPPEVTRLPGSK